MRAARPCDAEQRSTRHRRFHCRLMPKRKRSAYCFSSRSVRTGRHAILSERNLCGCKSSARSSGVVISHSDNTSGSVELRDNRRGNPKGKKTLSCQTSMKYPTSWHDSHALQPGLSFDLKKKEAANTVREARATNAAVTSPRQSANRLRCRAAAASMSRKYRRTSTIGISS